MRHDGGFGELVYFVEEDDACFAFGDRVGRGEEETLDTGLNVGSYVACLG